MGDTGIVKYGTHWGGDIELMHFFHQHLKFNISVESFYGWGNTDADSGNWTGMMGQLQKDELDVAFPVAFTHRMVQVVQQ